MHYSVMNFAEICDNCHMKCGSVVVRHTFKNGAPRISSNQTCFPEMCATFVILPPIRSGSLLRLSWFCSVHFRCGGLKKTPAHIRPSARIPSNQGPGEKAAEGTRRAWASRRVFDRRLLAGQIEAGATFAKIRSRVLLFDRLKVDGLTPAHEKCTG
jgi:hypothetical protein